MNKLTPAMEVKNGIQNATAIRFTPHEANKLKTAYLKAKAEQAPIFDAIGHTFCTSYAKYLLVYLAQQGLVTFKED